MKKIIVLITVFIMIFTFGGCNQQKNNPPKTEDQTPEQQDTTPQDTTKLAIGNIHLGDAKEEVTKAFGSDYKETYEEDPALLGEPFYKWDYDRGVTVIIGKNTNQVLEMQSTDSSLATNLGVKIGDTYDTVSKKYSAYKVATSNQDNSQLVGWYEIGDGMLMIFDFDKDDDAMVNSNVKPDSKVEKMEITYMKFID